MYDLTDLALYAVYYAKFDQTISVVQHYKKEALKTKSDVDSAIWLLPMNISDSWTL